jgi:hypothetical protein
MKVYIGKPKNWFGPYQLADALCFWVKDVKDEWDLKSKPDWVHNFGEWLAHGSIEKEDENTPFSFSRNKARPETWLYKLLLVIDTIKNKIRGQYIKIDYWDTWSIDHTLAPIILPMLKQLKETKHGSGYIDLEDVPESMRLISYEEYDSQSCFDFYHTENLQNIKCDVHTRFEWALDEMIFAFEHLVDDSWEDKYSSGVMDHYNEPCEWDANGKPKMYTMKEGPNHTYKCDYDALNKEWDRVNNGLRLFGKYFRTLWD